MIGDIDRSMESSVGDDKQSVKIGIMLEAFKGVELEKALEKIRPIGYQGVELFVSKGNLHLDLDSTAENVSMLKTTMDRYGIKVLSVCNSHEAQLILGPHDRSTDHLVRGSREEKRDYGVRRIRKTIEVAQSLGAPVVTVFTGAPDWGKWYPFPDLNVKMWEDYFQLFSEGWLPILDHAKEHQVRLAFEGEPGNLNYNLETSMELLRSVDNHPSLGICYDPSHMFWQGIDPINYVYELGDKIYNFHLKDVEMLKFRIARTGVMASGAMGSPARSFRFRVPGWGDLPWRKILSGLYEVHYKGPFVIELEDPLIELEKGLKAGYIFVREMLSTLYD